MSAPRRQRAVAGFTKTEIARVLRGAESAGFKVATFEIRPDGVMQVSRGAVDDPPADPFDTWKAKRDAR